MDVYSKARQLGIETEFEDGQGKRHVVSADALTIIIDALPAPRSSQYFQGPVVQNTHESGLIVPISDADGSAWQLLEAGRTLAEGTVENGATTIQGQISAGMYRLALLDEQHEVVDSVPVVVAPEKAWQGSGFDRIWLLTVQLYSVKSAQNWGMGDFSDLSRLIELSAEQGCAGIGLNPLHALFDDRPDDCSPYAPNSRLFLNPLYVDPALVPELPSAWLDENKSAIAAARHREFIDYKVVAKLKLAALRSAFGAFQESASRQRADAFETFRREGGSVLRRYACFEVLRRQFRVAWWDWSAEWRNPTDKQIDDFSQGRHADEVAFVAFVQWCAQSQLQACVDLATKCGMKLGLYLDVAVGVQSGGFDAWLEQSAISRQLSVGAPPDQLNTAGQDWGLAGFNAAGLEARNFEPFRAMLRASLKFAGAIRLDHVLGLNRLYLIPSGFSPRDGVYVDMPLQALLAVIAQESVAERCMIIGEDLGTVPDGFRDKLAARGILSYKVMMFERAHDGSFIDAEEYAANALVTFNTHDLSSFNGWRSGHDLRVKRAINVDPGETDEERARANAALESKLNERAISEHDLFGVTEFLAGSPSRILAVALEDLLGIKDQPNIPGTTNEHPNWRRRLPVGIDELSQQVKWKRLRHAVRSRS